MKNNFFAKSIFLTIMTFSSQSCSHKNETGYYKGYESPNYIVEQKFDNIEIRQYQPYLVAEVVVNGNRKEAANKGFRILASYIFGENIVNEKIDMTSPVAQSKSEKIAMTSPVIQSKTKSEKIAMTSPVNQIKADEEKWSIQFTMPRKYSLKTLPKAKDERISFKEVKAKKVIAIIFDGRWKDKLFVKNENILQDFIVQTQLKTIGESVFAYYDDPFTFPWNRRNEIIIEIK